MTSSTFKAIFHLSELGRIVKGFLYKVFHFVPLPRISTYCSGPKFWLPQKKGNYKVFEKCLEHYACCYKWRIHLDTPNKLKRSCTQNGFACWWWYCNMLSVRKKEKVLPQDNFCQMIGNEICISDFHFWRAFSQKSRGSKRCWVTQNLKGKAQMLKRGKRETFTCSMFWSLWKCNQSLSSSSFFIFFRSF